jgi:hypothetical protein
MRYASAKLTGSVAPAATGAAAAGGRPAPGGAVSDIILAVTECQIAPGPDGMLSVCRAYGVRDPVRS